MPLMDDINAAQKEFESAIKDMEAQKKEIDSLDSEYSKKAGDFSKEMTRVAAALKLAHETLDNWSEGYDSVISSLKEYNKDFATYKKKSVEIEKFYKDLKEEKDDRDKARKKLGAGSKPSKADEIADAAFKRAEKAYDNDPGKAIESMLKDIRATAKYMESGHSSIVSDLVKAKKEYDQMCAELQSFAKDLAVRAWNKDYSIAKDPIGSEFDNYFSKFKSFG